MQSEDKKLIYEAGKKLYSLLKDKVPDKINISNYSDEVEREFTEVVNEFIESFSEAHQFALALSEGHLNQTPPKAYNVFSSPFKQLHAQLKHLTWQAERIAAGDYNQRVDFMGDFSKAFNSMVVKLDSREKALKQAKDELEMKVAERTAELVETNELLEQDIIKRKQAEERLAANVKELKRLNKQLRDFSYSAAHDLKTPLRGIATLAHFIATDHYDKFDEEGRKQAKLLIRRVERMNDLIDSIIRYSMIERTEQKEREVDLNNLLAEVISAIKPPKNIEIIVENQLPIITCEKTHMMQVFENLLSNAVKYMDKPKGQVRIGCVEEHNFWKFIVTDNGRGIEEKHFERIFKIFQTLEQRCEFENIGIGLTIAKNIVELYGGNIGVESKWGEGSTFFFTFPKLKGDILEHTKLEVNTVI